MSLYNIAPDDRCMLYTGTQIRAAAENGLELSLNFRDGREPIKCRRAATVDGWCTAVSEKGTIFQDWAGNFIAGWRY